MHVSCAFVCVCPSVSHTVVQHLLGTCHSPLHSSSHSIKVTSLWNVPKEPGILPPVQTTQRPSAAHLSLIRRHRYEIQHFITELHSFQDQRERQLKKAIVSTKLSLALWLKPWKPNVSWKKPTGTQAVLSRMVDWPSSTNPMQKGCRSPVRYEEISGNVTKVC